MTRAAHPSGAGDAGARAAARPEGWAKAPDYHNDPVRRAAIEAATARDRQHYLRNGLTELECRACHACVFVKKASPHQTSVQWTRESAARCEERQRAECLPGRIFLACGQLKESIADAVAAGVVHVVQDELGVAP